MCIRDRKCTYRLDTEAEFTDRQRSGGFDDLAARRVPIQVERLVDFLGEYHCDGVVRGGRVELAAVSRYFIPPLHTPAAYNSGYVIAQDSPFAEKVLALHAEAARALELADGVTHLEVFETADGPVIGEVAIRPGGLGISGMWRHAFGVDLWEQFVRAALDEPSGLAARPHRQGTVGRTQLPAREGVRERALAMPGVIEALSAEQSGTGNVEVYFAAPGPEEAHRMIDRLHTLGEPQ